MANLDVSKIFKQFFQKGTRTLPEAIPEGIYEILEYEGTLELADLKGQTAIFRKRLRVKFLQDDVVAFHDHVWGDGRSLAAYICWPGVFADLYREGDRWNVLISLRQTKRQGSIQDYYIERFIKRGFTQAEEWWQLEMYHPIHSLKFSILFPKGRSCWQAVLLEKSTGQTSVFEPGQFTNLAGGRQRLTWETQSARRFETYTIKWRW